MEPDLVGQPLGQYQILDRLASGGMATVYKGYQSQLDRVVAVKVLPAALALRPQFVERFRREARAVARLDHPNIVPVYDFGEDRGVAYIVMKYVEGGTLKTLIEGRTLDLAQTAHIIGQVAQALAYAHERGVVHRDVKPSNVLLATPDWAQLSDFGIAKITTETLPGLTATGTGVGTAEYMAPEQATEAAAVDARADIYSLGVLLYQMVTGALPYNADTPMGVLIKHLYDPVPLVRDHAPDLPEALERIIATVMAKEPGARFQQATELSAALDALVAGQPLALEAPPPAPLGVPLEAPDSVLAAPPPDDLILSPLPGHATELSPLAPSPATPSSESFDLAELAMQPEHQTLFRVALAAFDVDDKDTARRLVMQILREDDHVAPAWLLLSYIENEFVDQMRCAENALAVAPDLEDAQLRVEQLKALRLPATFGKGRSAIPPVRSRSEAEIAEVFQGGVLEEPDEALDDPLQCPYCGVVNEAALKQCKHCGQDMMRTVAARSGASETLRMAFALNIGTMLMITLQLFAPMVWVIYLSAGDYTQGVLRIIFDQPPALLVAGPFYQILTPDLFFLLLVSGLMRLVLVLAVQVGLRFRLTWSYHLGLLAFAIEAAWALLAMGMQWTGVVIGVLTLLVTVSGFMALAASSWHFAVRKTRLLVEPERLKSGRAFWERGREYQRQGMWAMAVAQYRAAVGRAPDTAAYYKSLGIGYNRLGRAGRALRILEQAQRLDPTDLEVMTLVRRLREQQEAGPPRRSVIVPLGEQAESPSQDAG